ncbi:hypothetical protein TNCV_4811871 [Trichonephila clavipes]|nr:hypothetical protein TNCV_4811871 [Trichonephila clavipes]
MPIFTMFEANISSANERPSTSTIPVSTSCSSTQVNLLPPTSSIIPTMQSESQFIPISNITTNSSGNSLNTSASSLSIEAHLFLSTSDKFSALSTDIRPSTPLPETSAIASNSEISNASKMLKSF